MTLPRIEVPTKVPVGSLCLDRENPRLTGRADHHSEEALVAELYRSAELDELLQSMSSNGYLDIEPLVVMEGPESGELVVLEGNRRLAAIRLLTEPDFVSRTRIGEGLRLTVPEIPASLRPTFEQVTVYRVSDREQARPLIGFKHINGPQKWDAYAKARFAAKWHKNVDVGLSSPYPPAGSLPEIDARLAELQEGPLHSSTLPWGSSRRIPSHAKLFQQPDAAHDQYETGILRPVVA